LTAELDELKKYEMIWASDSEQLIRDLETLTRENQFVKDELKKASDERDYFRLEAENNGGEKLHLIQSLRSVEIDKEDIQNSYKEVCQENLRLWEVNTQLNVDNRDIFAWLQQAEEEVTKLTYTVWQVVDKEQSYKSEIHTLEQNITHLTY